MRDGELRLRAFEPNDEAALEAMFEEPEVKRWWPIGDYVSDSGWVVCVEDAFVGWLEYVEEPHRWYPSVAFDIALTSAVHGRRYGRRALALAVDRFAARGHHRFTVDPNVENARAIRCYEALGFERVGVMRAYELSAEGSWNDALLMELVVLPPAR